MPTKTRPNRSPVARQRESAETERVQRVSTVLGNPPLFGDVYIAPFDDAWKSAGPLPRVAREAALFISRVRRGVVFTPPEFLKTTIVQTVALWLTCRYAQLGRIAALTGMLFSEEAGLAERNLAVVAWHIENNPLIRADFVDTSGRPLLEPDEDEDKWTDSEIVVRRPGKIKDPTWQAKGVNSKGIQGARIRHMLGDDVVTPATATSIAQQAEIVRKWDEQVTTRVLDDGQAVIVGNFNHSRDAVSQIARKPGYAVLRRPSLYLPPDRSSAPKDPTDPDAVEQLPEAWPKRRLRQERTEKPNRFQRIHLLDESAEVGERLKLAWLQIIPPYREAPPTARFPIALDPAGGGEGDDLDFFNITVGMLTDEHLDVLISHDSRMALGDALELVESYHDRFDRMGVGVPAIGVAKVMLDRWFGEALAIMRPDLRRKLVPIPIGQASKTERLEALGPQGKSGWLRICQPAAESLTAADVDQPDELSFVEQWTKFPLIGHDDKLDGADVLCRTAAEFGYRGTSTKVKLRARTSRRR